MTILGVSTSDEECSVALWRDGAALGAETFPGARSCVEALMPMTDKLLGDHNVSFSDIELFAVDVGPGGLAGIKIGVSTVKTLAQASGRPVAAVSSLRAICHAAVASGAAAPGDLILPVVACTKAGFFAAVYRLAPGGGLDCVAPDRLTDPERLRELLIGIGGGDLLVLGRGAERARPAADGIPGLRARFAPPPPALPRAVSVCEIAARAGGGSYLEVQPNYLCLTQAERDRGLRS